jgi:hypothetical protein
MHCNNALKVLILLLIMNENVILIKTCKLLEHVYFFLNYLQTLALRDCTPLESKVLLRLLRVHKVHKSETALCNPTGNRD